jgi:hypothetical protein
MVHIFFLNAKGNKHLTKRPKSAALHRLPILCLQIVPMADAAATRGQSCCRANCEGTLEPVADCTPSSTFTRSAMSELDFADVSPHQRYERGWNRLQIIIETFVAIVVVAGVLGLFGTGPLSSTATTVAGLPITIKYDRILRRTLQSQFILDITQPIPDRALEIELPNAFLQDVDIVSTSPRSSAMRTERDGIVYVFDVGATRQGQVVFSLKPRAAGFMNSSMQVLGSAVSVRQFVFP